VSWRQATPQRTPSPPPTCPPRLGRACAFRTGLKGGEGAFSRGGAPGVQLSVFDWGGGGACVSGGVRGWAGAVSHDCVHTTRPLHPAPPRRPRPAFGPLTPRAQSTEPPHCLTPGDPLPQHPTPKPQPPQSPHLPAPTYLPPPPTHPNRFWSPPPRWPGASTSPRTP
jgi:hypothetical protein